MITPQEAKDLLDAKKAVLVDVREQDELVESGVAEGALWMPTSEIDEDEPRWQAFLKDLPRDKKVVLYCKSGMRSGRVAEFLKDAGFDAVNLGRLLDWKTAGYPITPWKK